MNVTSTTERESCVLVNPDNYDWSLFFIDVREAVRQALDLILERRNEEDRAACRTPAVPLTA
jgi:hypothetical protein